MLPDIDQVNEQYLIINQLESVNMLTDEIVILHRFLYLTQCCDHYIFTLGDCESLLFIRLILKLANSTSINTFKYLLVVIGSCSCSMCLLVLVSLILHVYNLYMQTERLLLAGLMMYSVSQFYSIYFIKLSVFTVLASILSDHGTYTSVD